VARSATWTAGSASPWSAVASAGAAAGVPSERRRSAALTRAAESGEDSSRTEKPNSVSSVRPGKPARAESSESWPSVTARRPSAWNRCAWRGHRLDGGGALARQRFTPQFGDEAGQVDGRLRVGGAVRVVDAGGLHQLPNQRGPLLAKRLVDSRQFLALAVGASARNLMFGQLAPQLDFPLPRPRQVPLQGLHLRARRLEVALHLLRARLEVDDLFERAPEKRLRPLVAQVLDNPPDCSLQPCSGLSLFQPLKIAGFSYRRGAGLAALAVSAKAGAE
jgi:hypothetical protein